MSDTRHPIVNLDALSFERPLKHGERFDAVAIIGTMDIVFGEIDR